ncbi:hypothetical protein NMG60_11017308 [Bertholletia excelsa]
MGTDLDPLDEFFPERVANNARAGSKFQPKAKPRPRKEALAPLVSRQPVQTVDIADNGLTTVENPSLDSSHTLQGQKPLKSNEIDITGVHSSNDSTLVDPTLDSVVIEECLAHNVDLHPNVVIASPSGDWHSTTGKSAGESVDIFFGLECLDDFYSHPANSTASAARSPDKADSDVHLGNEFAMSCPVNNNADGSFVPSEIQSVPVSDAMVADEVPLVQVVSPLDDSAARISNAASMKACPEVNIAQDSISYGEAVVSNSDGAYCNDSSRLETESQEAEDIPLLETLDNLYEITTPSGCRSSKFQPKPKFQVERDRLGTSTSILDGLESDSCFQDSQHGPSEIQYMDEGLIPPDTSNDILDFSALRFGDSTSHLPMNEVRTNLASNPQSDAFFPVEPSATIPEILEQEHQATSISGQDNEASRSTRQLRKRINASKLVHESEDEAYEDENFTNECPSDSLIDEDDIDYVDQVANETQSRRMSKKPKRSAPQKEKSIPKHKKENEVPYEAPKEHPKKFSHSSRRKRRQVDKVLLETPEDEIDVQKLRIRELIMLAEHRERISSKDGNTMRAPSTNQSAGNSFANHNEEGTFSSEVGGSSNGPTNLSVEESSSYTNYQSFMDKTPRSRWSKQDTELFYEAVRQFGSDISMIQQLFPDRTRNQVKLKYKKEERQHPLRLHEALTTRAKDHSHFQLVIERLQQIATQKKQNSCKEDTNSMTGDDVEWNAENDEEVSKSEQVEEGEVEATAPDIPRVKSPAKSCDSEDDLYMWSQYKSDL